MSLILQLGDRTITSAELLPLLTQYQMLSQLWREILIDKAIASVQLSNTEQVIAIEKYYKKHQLINTAERQTYLQHYGMSTAQLEALAIRELKIEKFKTVTWENKLGQTDIQLANLKNTLNVDRGILNNIA